MTNLTYNGQPINQRESDNYVNLGQLCATHGKKLNHWTSLKGSKGYLEALFEATGIPVAELIVVQNGNATWGHPLVAIEVSRWISPEFGVWCNTHIRTLIETGRTEIQPATPQNYIEALRALIESEEEKERQRIELERQRIELELADEDITKLSTAVDELFGYSSIIRVAKFNGVDEKQFRWQKLKAQAMALGLECKRVPCPRFEYKLVYPHEAWELAYPDVALPETSHWGLDTRDI